MLPLKPDPDATRDRLVRAAICVGRSALDRSIKPDKFIARTRPDDGDVPLILKASVGPMMQEDAPALQAISLGLPSGIVPQSAGADLFGRFRPT